MNLTSISQVDRLLADHGVRPKKRLGQSFLVDRNTLNGIVRACCIEPGENVLEIGAGLGTLTRELASTGASVVAVETDRGLEPVLNQTLEEAGRCIEVVFEDFLKLDLPEFLRARAKGRWVVVGNLPYYITSPILTKLIDARAVISRMLLMVQKEVAARLRARPATEDYGALSVCVQFHCEIETAMTVSRNVFFPVPEVDSELVRLMVRERPAAQVSDEALFFGIVRAAFGKRRKTLLNALSSATQLGWSRDRAQAALAAAGIDPGRRGETLSIDEFARLANGG